MALATGPHCPFRLILTNFRRHSERRPVPTIQKYEEGKEKQDREDEQQDAQLQDTPPETPPKQRSSLESHSSTSTQPPMNEKAEMMNRMSGPKGKPTDKVKNRRGEHTVKDPTTGLDVIIKDASFKGKCPSHMLRVTHSRPRLRRRRTGRATTCPRRDLSEAYGSQPSTPRQCFSPTLPSRSLCSSCTASADVRLPSNRPSSFVRHHLVLLRIPPRALVHPLHLVVCLLPFPRVLHRWHGLRERDCS